MEAILEAVAISCAVAVVLCAWKVVNLVWLKPKKLERLLSEQGCKGNKYKFLFGDMKEMKAAFEESKSKPISIHDDHQVPPRVLGFTHQAHQKHGKNFVIWFGWSPRVHIMEPDLIKDIFIKLYDFQKPKSNPLVALLATGLLSYDGDQWVKHRKLINPTFHLEKLKGMLPDFRLSCGEMIEKWENEVSSKGWCELDVWPHLQALTSDVISRTAFGSSYKEGIRIFELLREQSGLALEAIQSIYLPGFMYLPTKRNRKMKAISDEINYSIGNIINKRIKAMKTNKGIYDDLLGTLLESNIKEVEHHQDKSHGMTIDEVIEECKLFYFAGQETTSSLLVWTMILLSKHQEWQSRARVEVLNVFGEKGFDLDGLNRLKVVTMIFYEVLRLYPPVIGLGRKVNKDTKLGGILLPSGVQVGLPIMLLHYDEQIWGPDAKKFKPERFSEGVLNATKGQAVYFPFGGGPRICIGQNFAMLEAKIALAMILQNFSFEFSPSYVHAPHPVLILQPQYGAHLILHKL